MIRGYDSGAAKHGKVSGNLHKASGPRFLDGGSWSRGVTVSTPESSDRGSNPRGTFFGPSLPLARRILHDGFLRGFSIFPRLPADFLVAWVPLVRA